MALYVGTLSAYGFNLRVGLTYLDLARTEVPRAQTAFTEKDLPGEIFAGNRKLYVVSSARQGLEDVYLHHQTTEGSNVPGSDVARLPADENAMLQAGDFFVVSRLNEFEGAWLNGPRFENPIPLQLDLKLITGSFR